MWILSIYGVVSAFVYVAHAAGSGSPLPPTSPTSSVPGRAFDRFVIITLENTVGYPRTTLKIRAKPL